MKYYITLLVLTLTKHHLYLMRKTQITICFSALEGSYQVPSGLQVICKVIKIIWKYFQSHRKMSYLFRKKRIKYNFSLNFLRTCQISEEGMRQSVYGTDKMQWEVNGSSGSDSKSPVQTGQAIQKVGRKERTVYKYLAIASIHMRRLCF